MSSQERAVLSDFLLSPASLRDVVTLRQFTDIFPTAHRSNPAIKELYREIANLRKEDIELVRQNIGDEVRQSKQLRQQYRNARPPDDRANVPGLAVAALETEAEACGCFDSIDKHLKPHTLQTVHASIQEACTGLETEVQALEGDIDLALDELKAAIGDLSDLRYGHLAKSAGSGDDVSAEVLAALKRLEAACTDAAE
ncbi:hypothetical protein EJ04DRAFT_536265 [Polyplosphaeria fusca]|uniref:Cnl2/NKP2 family protein n=1 Tax=Polyplosphaeria fusca TaxID=682080 RepID=A0A9P4V0D0_9PLEO|nr:hypothetical protein EJ04DRAFT_536265 [Polyplosphaeria fusca]